MVECLSLNEINPKLQAVVPKVVKSIGLLLLKVVDNLSEALFGRTL